MEHQTLFSHQARRTDRILTMAEEMLAGSGREGRYARAMAGVLLAVDGHSDEERRSGVRMSIEEGAMMELGILTVRMDEPKVLGWMADEGVDEPGLVEAARLEAAVCDSNRVAEWLVQNHGPDSKLSLRGSRSAWKTGEMAEHGEVVQRDWLVEAMTHRAYGVAEVIWQALNDDARRRVAPDALMALALRRSYTVEPDKRRTGDEALWWHRFVEAGADVTQEFGVVTGLANYRTLSCPAMAWLERWEGNEWDSIGSTIPWHQVPAMHIYREVKESNGSRKMHAIRVDPWACLAGKISKHKRSKQVPAAFKVAWTCMLGRRAGPLVQLDHRSICSIAGGRWADLLAIAANAAGREDVCLMGWERAFDLFDRMGKEPSSSPGEDEAVARMAMTGWPEDERRAMEDLRGELALAHQRVAQEKSGQGKPVAERALDMLRSTSRHRQLTSRPKARM